VEISGLNFSYPDGSPALAGLSLTIAQNERVALAGANGAGKSTLLLHLNGLLRGRGVTVLGLPVNNANLKELRRKVGFVFQNPDDQLFCPNVFEDVAFGPRNLNCSAEEVRRRVQAGLRAVGLAGCEKRSAFHLSVGQKKRVALAAVLAMRPEVLALDEPTSSLDPRGRRELIALLKEIGGTQIIATHDFGVIRELCGRVVVLDQGQVAADGAPEAILRDQALLNAHGLA
jgi:cobalt/nickel transport system ATP-binding protein